MYQLVSHEERQHWEILGNGGSVRLLIPIAMDGEISKPVLESILNTRVSQMQAITIPSDSYRQDLLTAIQKIPTFPRKLASFLDYLIDYAATLNHELIRIKDQCGRVPSHTKQLTEDRIGNLSQRLGITESDDYQKCLSYLNCDSGSLSHHLEKLKQENSRLTSELQRAPQTQRTDRDEYDLNEMKAQFRQVEQELKGLRKDVSHKLSHLRRKPI